MKNLGKIKSAKIEENSIEARTTLLKAILRIEEKWQLSQSSLAAILKKDRSRITEWTNKGEIPNLNGVTKEALQNLIAVYRSLSAIFQNPSDQIKWLETQHPELMKKKPIEMMKDTMQGLITVRVYLDYVRGRGV